jgi:Calcineurin-like phosphoesterase
MRFAFIHTADWQIGKRFGAFPAEKAAVLRAQRLDAVDRVAEAARVAGASAVLVAGDVFDSETVSDALAGTLLSRLKAYPKLAWHLLPGNHDPARAGGVWEAIVAGGLPANVRVQVAPVVAEIAPGVVLLPAPLTSKSTSRDPTAWMDGAASPPGTVRIGLSHGSVQGFGSDGDADVPIDPARVKSAGLSYLALGDWHGTTCISARVWYSGTPEPDSFPDNEPGYALAVQIAGPSAVPKVERVRTAHFTWARRRQTVESAAGLDAIEAEVGGLGSAASRWLIGLKLEGHVTLAEFAQLEARLAKLTTQLFHLEPDLSGLHTEAAASDLEVLSSGVLGTVAERLKAKAAGSGEEAAVAARALRRLFALARRAEAGSAS